MKNQRPLYLVEEVRERERAICRQEKIDEYSLMQRAAAALWRRLRECRPAADRVLVVCGPGNNGGDGFVLAKIAREHGLSVDVVATRSVDQLQGPARLAAQDWLAAGGRIIPPGKSAAPLFAAAEVIVDALLGIGMDGPAKGEIATLIEAINEQHRAFVLAVDIPSGIVADTGAALGAAIRADVTVSFIAARPGLYTGEAPAHIGRLFIEPLAELPAVSSTDESAHIRLLGADCLQYLPKREPTSHKGQFGHALIIGGGKGMGGAAMLAASAALRAGAGKVSARVHADNAMAMLLHRPEVMVSDCEILPDDLSGFDGIAIGPGLGRDAWAQRWLQQLLDKTKDYRRGVVLDADALNLLAEHPRTLNREVVMTPHPGEAARLLKTDTARIATNRLDAARKIATAFNAVCLLKGAGTIIAHPDGRLHIAPYADGNLATAGSGDVLTGILVSLLAQGLPCWEAANLAAVLHGEAGQLALAARSTGLIAGDLVDALSLIPRAC